MQNVLAVSTLGCKEKYCFFIHCSLKQMTPPLPPKKSCQIIFTWMETWQAISCKSRHFQTVSEDYNQAIANSLVHVFQKVIALSAKTYFLLCSHIIFDCDHNFLPLWSKNTAECSLRLSMLLHSYGMSIKSFVKFIINVVTNNSLNKLFILCKVLAWETMHI